MDINIKIDDLVYPYFVTHGDKVSQEIDGFPGIYRFSSDRLIKDIGEIKSLGINKILIFGIPLKKDAQGSLAYSKNNLISQTVKKIKQEFKDLTVITDVCLCAYTNHGHCGLLENNSRRIDVKVTLSKLSDIAVKHAEAGADWVAPSAMAKKQVFYIRHALDEAGLNKTKILGYSAKFSSYFYGPFRNAANSFPRFGDRSAYQLDPNNTKEALDEIRQDIREKADAVMVKPALAYLDVVKEAKEKFNFPLFVYNVSGEYAMVKYAARLGTWDEKQIVGEIITSLKRAGADFIITYHAKTIAEWISKERQKL